MALPDRDLRNGEMPLLTGSNCISFNRAYPGVDQVHFRPADQFGKPRTRRTKGHVYAQTSDPFFFPSMLL